MNYNDFHTFSEYMKKEDNKITASMEDYVEMIWRLSMDTGFTRINELAEALNVHPPSVTRMVQRLGKLGLLKYEKYGLIILKESGRRLGKFLLKRHNIIEAFLRSFSIPEDMILTETEKIEHTLSAETTRCFEEYVYFIKDNPDIIDRFNEYKKLI
ncbi:metal-dependent transcriptional regulator [Clostridium neuense]|uniref:Manganese transport regulator n=1 Tax=Clostridium neuense TaxID=1728934 RepID=A0ABW8TF60_9CLOT